LRIFACLWVFFFHWFIGGTERDQYNFSFPKLSIPGLPGFGHFGYLGVDIFFILSGTVIAQTAVGRSAPAFMKARFLRLYPGIALASLATIPVMFLQPGQTFGHRKYAIFQGLQNATGFPILAAIRVGKDSFYIGDSWTLAVEILFYILVAVAIFIFLGLTQKKLELLAILTSAIVLLLSINTETGYSAHFLFGILLFCSKSIRDFMRLLPFLLISGLMIIFKIHSKVQRDPASWQYSASQIGLLVTIMIAFVALLILFRGRAQFKSQSVGENLRTLSLMTYPFYLLHETFGLLFVNLLFLSLIPFWLSYTISFLVVLIISWLSVRFIEPEFQRLMIASGRASRMFGRFR